MANLRNRPLSRVLRLAVLILAILEPEVPPEASPRAARVGRLSLG